MKKADTSRNRRTASGKEKGKIAAITFKLAESMRQDIMRHAIGNERSIAAEIRKRLAATLK